LGLAQAGAAAALAVGGVVGVGGVKAMAALAVGLAGLGMAGGRPALGATGPLEGDEAADDLLGLTAPDAVLLASPHREVRQASRTEQDSQMAMASAWSSAVSAKNGSYSAVTTSRQAA
jgi:hypothetical protein